MRPLLEDLAKGAITVANEVARCPVPGKRLGVIDRSVEGKLEEAAIALAQEIRRRMQRVR